MNIVFKNKGFTIVELLIVVVVIAILASITVVSYQGIQKRAVNASHYDEVQKWQQVFMAYAAVNGQYPNFPSRKFCLGTDFPAGTNGESRCQNFKDVNLYTYPGNTGGINILASDSNALNSELATISTNLPKNDRSIIGNIIGPWIMYYDSKTGGTIFQTFYNTDPCPSAMNLEYAGSTLNVCSIALPTV